MCSSIVSLISKFILNNHSILRILNFLIIFAYYTSFFIVSNKTPICLVSKWSQYIFFFGFRCSSDNSSLFIYWHETNLILLLVYVNAVILIDNVSSLISWLIYQLHEEFTLKNLCQLNYFLNFEVKYFSSGLKLSQTKYANDLLAKAKMLEAFKINTPIVSKTTHSRDDHGPIDSIEYCQLCDSLQYLILTRPDLTHVVNLMWQIFKTQTWKFYMQCIWRLIKRTLTYDISIFITKFPYT